MITSAILYGFLSFLRLILGGILTAGPVSLDTGIGGALAAVGSSIAVLDVVVDVGLLISTFVGTIVVVEGYIFSYKIIKWIYTKIPGIN